MASTSDNSVQNRLVTVCEKLQIPNNTMQITLVRLDQLRNEPDVNEDRLDDTAAAALALSAREDGLPVRDEDIASAWSKTLNGDGDISITSQQLEAVSDYFDIQEVPPHPNSLVQRFGEAVDMPEELVTVAHRLLQDAFALDATVVSGGPSPAATAGGVLSLAALVNGLDDNYEQSTLGKASATSEVSVRNRCQDLQNLLDDRLSNDRYRVVPASQAPDQPSDESQTDAEGEAATAADGAGSDGGASGSSSASGSSGSSGTTGSSSTSGSSGSSGTTGSSSASGSSGSSGSTGSSSSSGSPGSSDSSSSTASTADGEAVLETVRSVYPDELPTTTNVAETHDTSEAAAEGALKTLAEEGALQRKRAGSVDVWIPAGADESGTALTVDAVETEIDVLVEELDIGSSTRLLARGMVSDAVEDANVEDAAELAATTVVAAARMSGGDADIVEVAGRREFEPRVIAQWLDTLDEAVDADIPRRDPEDIVEDVVAELGLSEAVLAESHRSLERFDGDVEAYTAAELGAGAVLFAATISQTQIDVDRLAAVAGAGTDHVTSAMHKIVTSLCLSLVRGDIEYEDCAWTTELLQSELTPTLGDSETGRAIAIAKAYTAGREGQYVDDQTLDVLRGE
jgi:transcription initiation factor TFIIIB Brf1 subunit/transcription initiation factor TFIIB